MRERMIVKPTRLAEMLRLYRTVNKLSLRDVVKGTSFSFATWSRIEQGREMDTKTFLELIRWLREAHNDQP